MIAAEVSTGNPLADVIIALMGSAAVVLVAWLPLRRMGNRVEAVKEEVTTNHGRRSGEYVELIYEDLKQHRKEFHDFKVDHEVRLRLVEKKVDSAQR